MDDHNHQLPQRQPGTHLPRAAFHVPNVDPDRWHVDEKTLMVIINGLRRWQITGPVVK